MNAPKSSDLKHLRSKKKFVQRSNVRAELANEFGSSIRALETVGYVRDEIVAMILKSKPELTPNLVREVVLTVSPDIRVRIARDRMSDEVLEMGIWHNIGFLIGLEKEFDSDLELFSDESVSELTRILEFQGIVDGAAIRVFRHIAGGRQAALDFADMTISGQQYNDARDKFLSLTNCESGKGLNPWPPTKQTVIRRLGNGYWNEALVAVGLVLADRQGRSRGPLEFHQRDLALAMRRFLLYALSEDARPTSARYDEWARRLNASGDRVPSGSSIRNHFGSWHDAIVKGKSML